MKKIILPLLLCAFFLISNKSFSQDWLPKPVTSPYLDALLGTWTADPYEFMGNVNTEIVTYNMILNGQYLEIDFKRSDDKGFTYEGKEIVVPSPDGSMKGSYYDIMRNDRSSLYTAKMEGDKFILTSASLLGTGSREIIIDGNTMINNVTFVMNDKSGNPLPEQKMTITYKKTN